MAGPVSLQAVLGAVEDGLTLGAPVAAVTEPGVGEELDDQFSLAILKLQLGHNGRGNAVRPVSTGGQKEGVGDLLMENCPLRVLHLECLPGHQGIFLLSVGAYTLR